MRVRFKADWDHVTPESTTSFKAGAELTLAKEVALAAIDAKKAEEVPLLKDQKADDGQG
jgi:hypothetical protein